MRSLLCSRSRSPISVLRWSCKMHASLTHMRLRAAPAALQPEQEPYENDEGELEVDVGVVFNVAVTKGDKSLV